MSSTLQRLPIRTVVWDYTVKVKNSRKKLQKEAKQLGNFSILWTHHLELQNVTVIKVMSH